MLFPGLEVHPWGSFYFKPTYPFFQVLDMKNFGEISEVFNSTTQLEAKIPCSEMQAYFLDI